MKRDKGGQGNPAPEKKEIEGKKFYPDIAYNKKERNKTVLMAILLVFLCGGIGITIMLGKQMASFISGGIMLIFLVLGVSMVPSAFKHYPVKHEPIITVFPKEAIIGNETIKISDIKAIRLTITVGQVGKKEDNIKFLDSIATKEPEKGLTADLDFELKTTGKKDKTLYTTVADAYEALVAFYNAGVKHYKIMYSMKKLTKVSTYDIANTMNEDGVKLGNISKKDRLKQLY